MTIITRAATAGLMGLAGLIAASPVLAQDKNNPQFTPCFIDGVRERARCASLEVPLDYDAPDGAAIKLHFVVVPALSGTPAADPLFILAGGPGQAAAEYGALIDRAFSAVHNNRDIVLLDQRGTGRSSPLKCDYTPFMDDEAKAEEVTGKCLAAQSVDVRPFTMENVIRDMDSVRAWLGAEQINLWGGSYGTRTAALYLKRFPEHVRAMVMDGVLPPDVPLFTSAPVSAERAKAKMADACAASPACTKAYGDLNVQIETLMEKARAGELHYKGLNPVTGAPVDTAVDFGVAVESVRSVMYAADATITLPYVIDAANKGNLSPIMAGLMGGQAIAESMYQGATLSILCGEEVPRVTAEQAAAAGKDSFARDSYHRFWTTVCADWPSLPPAADAYDAVQSDVPSLILSGDLDPVTPPELGAHLAEGLSNSRHIIVPGNGHISSYVACMPALIGTFLNDLDGAALDTSCLETQARLPFITGINGNTE